LEDSGEYWRAASNAAQGEASGARISKPESLGAWQLRRGFLSGTALSGEVRRFANLYLFFRAAAASGALVRLRIGMRSWRRTWLRSACGCAM